MGKYIVKITKRQTQEVVVDAGNAEEAKRRGLATVASKPQTH